jgi:GH15 family glucan-1,4-alpha-glucosidase
MTTADAPADTSDHRIDGYPPLRSYAAVGDGRTIALIARDGAVDWLPWPDLDSPSVFAAVVDAKHGGVFQLAPSVPFSTKRRYLPGTNVLETRFLTGGGEVRLIDAMSLRGDRLGPSRELQRRIAGVSGKVPMVWTVRPRFGYGQRRTRLGWRGRTPVATSPATRWPSAPSRPGPRPSTTVR